MGSVIYEMMGIPGCGKSSICENVDTGIKNAFHTEKDFYSVLRKKMGRILSFRYCLAEKSKVRNKLLRECKANALPGKEKLAEKKVLKLLRFKGIHAKNSQNFLLSEGYLQAVLEIMDALQIKSLEECDSLYKYVINDLQSMKELHFILVSVPEDVALSRIPGRTNRNSVDAMDEEQRKAFLEHRIVNTKALMDLVWANVSSDRVLGLDGTGSVSENAKKLSDWMRK